MYSSAVAAQRPGRKPIYPHAASVRLEIRVTPGQRDAVQRAAEQQGTGISGIIRELIDERVEDRRPFPGGRVTWDGDDEA